MIQKKAKAKEEIKFILENELMKGGGKKNGLD